MRSSQLHRNRTLENISVAYTPQGYIADMLSPRYMVEQESNDYYVYSKDALGLPETIRADGAESNRASFNVSTASYRLDYHAIHEDITDRQRGNVDKAIRLDADVTEMLTNIILLRRESDLQSVIQTATNWANSTSLSAAQAWSSNTTTTNPISFVDSAASVILVNSGRRPNKMVMNDQVFNDVKEHTSIVDRIKYTSAQSVSPQMIAGLLRVGEILVPEVSYNSADEGLADSMSRVWNDTVWLGFVDPTPGLRKVTAVATFWQNQSGVPYAVKKWREEKIEADRVEVQAGYQHKIIASDCAYIFIDAH